MGRHGFHLLIQHSFIMISSLIFKPRFVDLKFHRSSSLFPLWPAPIADSLRKNSARRNCRRETFPQLFLPLTANNRAAANVWAPLICPSLLSAEWLTAWGKDHLRFVAPLHLRGLYVTERGGNTSERRRSAAAQFRRAERRGAVRERRLTIRQLAGGTHTNNPYGCLRNNDTPPLPLFSLSLGLLAFSIIPNISCCKS